MHGYPVMQVVQYSVPPCSWPPPVDSHRSSQPTSVSPRAGIRKYVVWCLICGGLSCLLGIMFLGVYFLVRSYTSTIGYFETVPTFVPATLLSQVVVNSCGNQIYSNRPFVRLFNKGDSSASVYQVWTEDNIKDFQDCAFTVDSNLYFAGNRRFGRGLTLSLKKMNFRVDSNGQCIDYVRFTFPELKTDKICGTFDAESEIGQQTFFFDPLGIIKVHIFVNKSVALQTGQRSVEIDLSLTAYEQCSSSNLIRCHPSDDSFCISKDLVGDGVHNCMPPSNADEPNRPFPTFGPNQGNQQGISFSDGTSQKNNGKGAAAHIHTKHGLVYIIISTALLLFNLEF